MYVCVRERYTDEVEVEDVARSCVDIFGICQQFFSRRKKSLISPVI